MKFQLIILTWSIDLCDCFVDKYCINSSDVQPISEPFTMSISPVTSSSKNRSQNLKSISSLFIFYIPLLLEDAYVGQDLNVELCSCEPRNNVSKFFLTTGIYRQKPWSIIISRITYRFNWSPWLLLTVDAAGKGIYRRPLMRMANSRSSTAKRT